MIFPDRKTQTSLKAFVNLFRMAEAMRKNWNAFDSAQALRGNALSRSGEQRPHTEEAEAEAQGKALKYAETASRSGLKKRMWITRQSVH